MYTDFVCLIKHYLNKFSKICAEKGVLRTDEFPRSTVGLYV